MVDQVQLRLSEEKRESSSGEVYLYRGWEQVGQLDICVDLQVLQHLFCLLQEEMGRNLGSCFQMEQRMGAEAEKWRNFYSVVAILNCCSTYSHSLMSSFNASITSTPSLPSP